MSLSGHGSCLSHVYPLTVGVVCPPQVPALYMCSPWVEQSRLAHTLQANPLPVSPQVPERYRVSGQTALVQSMHPVLPRVGLYVVALHFGHVFPSTDVESHPHDESQLSIFELDFEPSSYVRNASHPSHSQDVPYATEVASWPGLQLQALSQLVSQPNNPKNPSQSSQLSSQNLSP